MNIPDVRGGPARRWAQRNQLVAPALPYPLNEEDVPREHMQSVDIVVGGITTRLDTTWRWDAYFQAVARARDLAPRARPQPVRFVPRRQRIDWLLLHGIDVDRVFREGDLDTLERASDTIIYGDITSEDTRNFTEVNFVKIFRLAQMLAERRDADCLFLEAEAELRAIAEKVAKAYALSLEKLYRGTRDEKQSITKDKMRLAKENRHMKQVICTYDIMLHRKMSQGGESSEGMFSCLACARLFLTEQFRNEHMARRHPRYEVPPPAVDRGVGAAGGVLRAPSFNPSTDMPFHERVAREVKLREEEWDREKKREIARLEDEIAAEKNKTRWERDRADREKLRADKLNEEVADLNAKLLERSRRGRLGVSSPDHTPRYRSPPRAAEAQAAIQQLEEENERMARELQVLRGKYVSLEGKNGELKSENDQLKSDNDHLKSNLDRARSRLGSKPDGGERKGGTGDVFEDDEVSKEVDKRTAELRRESRAHLRKIQKLEDEISRLEMENKGLKDKLKNKPALSRDERDTDGVATNVDKLRIEMARADRLDKENQRLQNDNQRLRGENQRLKGKVRDSEQRLAALQDENGASQQAKEDAAKVKELQDQVERLMREAEDREEEIERLRDEALHMPQAVPLNEVIEEDREFRDRLDRVSKSTEHAKKEKQASKAREEAAVRQQEVALELTAKLRQQSEAILRRHHTLPDISQAEKERFLKEHPYSPHPDKPSALSRRSYTKADLGSPFRDVQYDILEELDRRLEAFGLDPSATRMTDEEYVVAMDKLEAQQAKELKDATGRERQLHASARAALQWYVHREWQDNNEAHDRQQLRELGAGSATAPGEGSGRASSGSTGARTRDELGQGRSRRGDQGRNYDEDEDDHRQDSDDEDEDESPRGGHRPSVTVTTASRRDPPAPTPTRQPAGAAARPQPAPARAGRADSEYSEEDRSVSDGSDSRDEDEEEERRQRAKEAARPVPASAPSPATRLAASKSRYEEDDEEEDDEDDDYNRPYDSQVDDSRGGDTSPPAGKGAPRRGAPPLSRMGGAGRSGWSGRDDDERSKGRTQVRRAYDEDGVDDGSDYDSADDSRDMVRGRAQEVGRKGVGGGGRQRSPDPPSDSGESVEVIRGQPPIAARKYNDEPRFLQAAARGRGMTTARGRSISRSPTPSDSDVGTPIQELGGGKGRRSPDPVERRGAGFSNRGGRRSPDPGEETPVSGFGGKRAFEDDRKGPAVAVPTRKPEPAASGGDDFDDDDLPTEML